MFRTVNIVLWQRMCQISHEIEGIEISIHRIGARKCVQSAVIVVCRCVCANNFDYAKIFETIPLIRFRSFSSESEFDAHWKEKKNHIKIVDNRCNKCLFHRYKYRFLTHCVKKNVLSHCFFCSHWMPQFKPIIECEYFLFRYLLE